MNTALEHDLKLSAQAIAADDDWQPGNYAALIREVAEQLDDELMGSTHDRIKPGAFRLFIELISHQETLGLALQKLVSLYGIATHSLKFELTVVEGVAYWAMQINPADVDTNGYLRETLPRAVHSLSSFLIGAQIQLREVQFTHKANGPAIEYARIFHCPVLFEQDRHVISFDASYLERRIVRSEEDLAQLWAAISQKVDGVTIPGDTSVGEAVRAEARLSFLSTQQFPTLDELADRFFKSPQTLRRRLKEEGIRYADLKEGIRREVVVQWLENPSIPLKQVADIGGFAEPAGLSRAVKHWFGVSPSEYRQQVVGQS
jgi:AraC-like DNA-binding protein